MIAPRQKTGPLTSLVLSLVFGFVFVLVATADLFIVKDLPLDKPPPFTVRIPNIGIYKDTITGGASYRHVKLRHPRGVLIPSDQRRLIQAYEEQRRPPSTALLLGIGLAFFLLLFFYTSYLRLNSPLTALFRTQFVLLLGLLFLAVVSKLFLAGTSWSAMWIPLAAIIIPVAHYLGARAAGSTAIAGSILLSLLIPIDLPLMAVMIAQGLAAGFTASRKKGILLIPRSALAAMIAGGSAYIAMSLLLQQFVPVVEMVQSSATITSWLNSDLIGACGGGILGGAVAYLITPYCNRLFGVISKTKLIALANFDNPLLKQMAAKAPGTWAHSLTMANMAEMAANAIGADALLVRVGAYYHDLGKAVQPEYFIENQDGVNPHDSLESEVSADAIFAHITEGVKLARKHKIPERIIEFIYTHHGDGLLEYFWHKNLSQGNPQDLSEKDFRYPGCPPQTPETAILAICDATEAASRTIEDPEMDKIKRLVQQIVFTKLDQSMLNDAGISVQDLQKIVKSLVETLKSSLHVRVKYPWQEEDKKSQPAVPTEEPAQEPAQDPAQNLMVPAPDVERTSSTERAALLQPNASPPHVGSRTQEAAEVPTEGDGDPEWVKSMEFRERHRVSTMPLGTPSQGVPPEQPEE